MMTQGIDDGPEAKLSDIKNNPESTDKDEDLLTTSGGLL